jgi:hypothetical protein
MTHVADFSVLFAVALGAASSTGETQKASSANSLPRAFASYAAADADRDGRISQEEARAIPASPAVFTAEDENKDGFWSREEFLVFYRHQLIAGGQPVGVDLEAEITRLQALKRVRAVEETKGLTAETSARCANAETLAQRFESALADLETKCAARKASREDFQRLRNLVILNGRAPQRTGNDPGTASSQSTMLEALNRIEKSASLGRSTKEDLQVLRGSVPAATSSPTDGRARVSETDRGPSREPSRTGAQAGAQTGPVASSAAPAARASPSSAPAGPAPAGPAEGRQRAQQKSDPKVNPTPRPPPAPPPPDRPAPNRTDKDKSDRSRP